MSVNLDYDSDNEYDSDDSRPLTHTVTDPKLNWVGPTVIATGPYPFGNPYESTTRRLRRRLITVWQRPREPGINCHNCQQPQYIRQLEWLIQGNGVIIISRTTAGKNWLCKTQLGRAFLAVPQELRRYSYVQLHWHALTVTGLLEEFGLAANGYRSVEHLITSHQGRAYLHTIHDCPALTELRLNDPQELHCSLIGRIHWWLHSAGHHTFEDFYSQQDYSVICRWCTGRLVGASTHVASCICRFGNRIDPEALSHPLIAQFQGSTWSEVFSSGAHIIPGFSQQCCQAYPLQEPQCWCCIMPTRSDAAAAAGGGAGGGSSGGTTNTHCNNC